MLKTSLVILSSPDRRGASRDAARSFGTVRGNGEERHSIVVEDFSETGFSFRALTEFAIGTLVELGEEIAGRTRATVVWQKEKRHGCRFVEESPAASEPGVAKEPSRPYTGVVDGDDPVVEHGRWPGWIRIALFVATCGLIWYGIYRLIR